MCQAVSAVLLDGESGCGKSALVSAGLAPELVQSNGLMPVAIADWGDDWMRGPLAAALGALFHSVSQTEREKLGWVASPDLATDTPNLAADLDVRLKAVFDTLGRRPLLIADQFDDYQARHRNRFLDDETNWLAPAALVSTNRFWELVNSGLGMGRLHLLVITRADMAAGLSCVRFLGEDQIATRTLPRVDVEYLHLLLTGIATEDAKPVIVMSKSLTAQDIPEGLRDKVAAKAAVISNPLLQSRQLHARNLAADLCQECAGKLDPAAP